MKRLIAPLLAVFALSLAALAMLAAGPAAAAPKLQTAVFAGG